VAIGASIATVQRDLAIDHRRPERVIGLDRKSHPASKGTNGSRSAA
jgi:hypothetical protein